MIVIVGGTGRLGELVARRLVADGHPVRIVSRAAGAHPGHGTSEAVAADVRDPQTLAAACDGATVIVSAMHGFADPGAHSPASVDRDGNRNIVDIAERIGADLVMVSIAGAAADSPMELFRMKHAAERYLIASRVPATIIRPTAFIELWIDILRQTASRSGRPVVFGRGANPINFVSVTDVAALVARVVLDRSHRGDRLDIGGPRAYTFNELAAAVQAADGRDEPPRHVPVGLLRIGAAAAGAIRPAIARQLRAAIAMDRLDLSRVDESGRVAYPDLPRTTLGQILAGTEPPRW